MSDVEIDFGDDETDVEMEYCDGCEEEKPVDDLEEVMTERPTLEYPGDYARYCSDCRASWEP